VAGGTLGRSNFNVIQALRLTSPQVYPQQVNSRTQRTFRLHLLRFGGNPVGECIVPGGSAISVVERAVWTGGGQTAYYLEQAELLRRFADMETRPNARARLAELASKTSSSLAQNRENPATARSVREGGTNKPEMLLRLA
jgi:hypothetical protein